MSSHLCLVLLGLVFGVAVNDAFKIAAFNVRNFGPKKMENPEVLGIILETIQRYDIVLIQEIRDKEEREIQDVRSIINQQEVFRYGLRVSQRLGRTKNKEQYAFFFRKDTGISIDDTMQYDDGEDGKCKVVGKKGKWGKILECPDAFEREPYIVRVTSEKTKVKDFALIAIHTKPDDAINELNNLPKVVDQVMEKWGVKNVMILGDLNAGCTYIEKDEWSKVTMRNDPNYTWFINDDVDTTVTESKCAYDRFIVRGQELLDAIIPESATTYNFDKDYSLNQSMAEAVSDHYPIEMRLKMADGEEDEHGAGSCGGPPPPFPTGEKIEEVNIPETSEEEQGQGSTEEQTGKKDGEGEPMGGTCGKKPISEKDGEEPLGGTCGKKPISEKDGEEPLGGTCGKKPISEKDGEEPLGGTCGKKPISEKDGKELLGGTCGKKPIGEDDGEEPEDKWEDMEYGDEGAEADAQNPEDTGEDPEDGGCGCGGDGDDDGGDEGEELTPEEEKRMNEEFEAENAEQQLGDDYEDIGEGEEGGFEKEDMDGVAEEYKATVVEEAAVPAKEEL